MTAVRGRRSWWHRLLSSGGPVAPRCAAAHESIRPSVGRLEPRVLLAGDVVISEFLAINGSNLPDEDGEFSDWIELQNVAPGPVNLDGWYLTDDPANLTRWRFPAVTIQPGAFMLVFASDKNRKVPGQPLHTNFKLDGGGEYLALIMPDGVTVSYEFAPTFPRQESNISYGTGVEAPVTTALVPTPASANYLVPPDGTLGTGWTAIDFDDAAWTGGQTAVGFEVGSGGASAVLPQEQEPNNSPADADDASTNFLPAPAAPTLYQLAIKGNLANGEDDFYNIGQLQPGDVLSVSHSGSTGARGTLGDPLLRLYRGNPAAPTLVTSVDDALGLDSFLHRFTVAAADTYYVDARAYSEGYSGSYETSVWLENGPGTPAPSTAGPPPAESEPNNTAATADDASAGWRAAQYRSSTTGAVTGSGPAAPDYFKYRFTAGDVVTVMVDSVSGLNAAATLYAPNGATVVAQDNVPRFGIPADAVTDARLLAYRVPATGVYYVQVGSSDDTSGAYRLDVYLSTPTPPPVGSSYGGVIRSDLEAAMFERSATAYVRVPFNYSVAGLPDVASMALSIQYDDGFVAYLNGAEVARRNAPAGALGYDAAALAERPQPDSTASETIDLTAFRSLLVEGRNVLALHGLNSAPGDEDFLLLPRLELSTRPVLPPPSYFTIPTPGARNDGAPINLGPQISNVSHSPHEPADDQDVVVTAKVSAPVTGVSQVTLKYRVMYNPEASVPMLDDGAHGDGAAGDGVYGAAIPAAVTVNGRMVRYAITAADTGSRTSRAPLHAADNSPEYYGLVVRNDAVWASPMPVFHFFTQNPGAATTRAGTRASVYYDGEFYDNVFVRDRGGFSSDGFKFDFNPGDRFRWWDDDTPTPGASRVDEINLNYNSAYDETRLRASLAFETFAAAGVPSLTSFPMRIQQNGGLFRLATFVENPDSEYLDRVGLDGRNPMYKPIGDDPQMTSAFRFDKLTARGDGNSDLQAFLDGIHSPLRHRYIFDHVDLPAFLNYWAANTIVNDNDNVQKNYLLYRDTTGDGEWMFLPWDKDLTFGKHWGIPDYGARDPQTHPFFGDAGHPKMDGPHAYNYLIDVLFQNPTVRQMYLRRLRTLMDRLLQPASTPLAERHFERRMDEMFAQISADPAAASTVGGAAGLRASLNNIRDLYLQARRNHLYVNHGENINYPDHAGIPAAQPASAPIDIVSLDYNPALGNQDQEYVQLTNPNNFAVDLSGWKFAGAVDYVFPEGAVLAPRRSMYVARDLIAFRARTTGPGGNQGLFAIGGYDGQLSARGETLVLTDAGGATVDTYTWDGTPTGAQQALRVSEIMYHPHDAPGNTPLDENFEYVEFQNISGQSINLAGVKFTQGVNVLLGDVTLQPGAYALVVKNRAAFTQRYGAAAAEKIVGEYPLDILDNGGERIRLEDASGEVVLDFNFDHAWYASTDGLGRSLVIRDAGAPVGTWGDGPAWRPSGALGGSPGGDDDADTVVPTVDIVDVTPDPRTTPVESIVIRFSEPVYGLELADIDLTRNGLPIALDDAAQTLTSVDGGATWTVGTLGALTAAGGRYVLALRRDGTGVADYGGNPLAQGAEESWGVPMPPAAVVGRHLFYNNSTYDGRAATGAADDAAVAPDKVALRPGQAATLANITNYSGGINGVVIDVSGLRGNLTAADFVFQMSGRGAGNVTWGAAPAPTAITRRPGAGGNGADRVTLTWADGAIVDRWLRVTLKANEITGLAADDVFHFGNLVGETGDMPGAATVTANDVTRTRARQGGRSTLSGWFDFNRDGRVNAIDGAQARSHVRRSLPMFAAPSAAPASAAASFGDSPILPPAPRRAAYRPATDLLQ